IPTYLVCEMARRDVTVALSGDGGDESLCGYSRFLTTTKAWENLQCARGSVLGTLKGGGLALPPQMIAPFVKVGLPSQRNLALKTVTEKLARTKRLHNARTLREYYHTGVSYWFEPETVVLGATEPPYVLTELDVERYIQDPLKQLMLLDSMLYLPDDILVKVDRAAMACSLETRVPFLDHRVIEYAATIPVQENLINGGGKQLLKDLLYRYVPRELVDRPKRGFAVPLASWLRGPLRDWAEALLEPMRLGHEGYFH